MAAVSGPWLLGSKVGKWRFEGLSANLVSAVLASIPQVVRKGLAWGSEGGVLPVRVVAAAVVAGHCFAWVMASAMVFLQQNQKLGG